MLFRLAKRSRPWVRWRVVDGTCRFEFECSCFCRLQDLHAHLSFPGVRGLTPGCILAPLYFLLWLAILFLHIGCIAKGTKGERLIVPGVSQYADRF